jgi:hypothetical protein
MQGVLIDCRHLDHGESQQGKYEERKKKENQKVAAAAAYLYGDFRP